MPSSIKSYNNLIGKFYGGFDHFMGDAFIIKNPMSFIKAGSYDASGNKKNLTQAGGYWDSQTNGTTNAYYFNFGTDKNGTSYIYHINMSDKRGNGHSLRCVSCFLDFWGFVRVLFGFL